MHCMFKQTEKNNNFPLVQHAADCVDRGCMVITPFKIHVDANHPETLHCSPKILFCSIRSRCIPLIGRLDKRRALVEGVRHLPVPSCRLRPPLELRKAPRAVLFPPFRVVFAGRTINAPIAIQRLLRLRDVDHGGHRQASQFAQGGSQGDPRARPSPLARRVRDWAQRAAALRARRNAIRGARQARAAMRDNQFASSSLQRGGRTHRWRSA